MLREIMALCVWNIRGLAGRLRGALVVVVGFFGVVLVFSAVLSIRDGLWQAAHPPGGDGVAIVLGRNYTLNADVLRAAENAPEVARDANGAMLAPTLVTSVIMENWKPGMFSTAVLRGVTTEYARVTPDFRLIRGRMFHAGADEVIVGRGDARLYPQLVRSGVLTWNHRQWRIVGVYATAPSSPDSEFLTDLNQLQAANNAGKLFTDLFVKLRSAGDFAGFKRRLENHPGIAVNVETLSQRFMDFNSGLTNILFIADGVITALMAVGAIFGALNVMYANVATRTGELATLRALGFTRMAILSAVLSEALILALAGGAAGVAVAYLVFDGLQASTEAGQLIAFSFAVTPAAVAAALALAVLMGFAGGFFPSLRAARLPIAQALRDA